MRTHLRWATFVAVACLPNVLWAAVSLTVTTHPGSNTISGTPPTMNMGNVNGLGVGGTSVVTSGVTGGVLYVSQYDLNVTVTAGDKNSTVNITATVTSNFTHSTALIAKNCLPGICTSGGSFSTIPTAGSITVASGFIGGGGPSITQTFSPTIAVFVSNTNGSSFNSTDQVTIRFTATGTSTGNTGQADLNLTATMQNAVQLTLGTAPGGLTISPASDYTANFGNVNALGVGTPSAGLTKIAAANGTIYSTPYLIQPAFSDQASTTGSIKMYVSANFANTTVLELDDASTCCTAGSFTALPTTSPGTAQITGLSSGSSTTRYLGLRVKKANGAAGLTGSDNATITFSLTVP